MRPLVVIALVSGCSSSPATVTNRSPAVTQLAPASPGIELPEVAMVGYAKADDVVPAIAVSPTAFTVRGTQALLLRDGALAPGDRDKLEAAIGVDVATAVPDVALAFDRRVPFATLVETLHVLDARGAKRFRLLARSGAGQVAVAFERDPTASDARRDLVCTIQAERLLVWSHSGSEGTRAAPKLVIDRAAPSAFRDLTDGLREIVDRRWPRGRPRDNVQPIAIAVEDPAAQIQLVAETFGAVRVAPDGVPLFAEIRIVIP